MTYNMQIVSESRLDTPNLSILDTRLDVIVSNVNDRQTEPSTLSGMSITKCTFTSGLLRLIANVIILRFTFNIINLSRSAVIRTEFGLSQSPPILWNDFRDSIKSAEHAIAFRRHLKTCQFNHAYAF